MSFAPTSSLEEEAKRAKTNKKGQKELKFSRPLFAFFASLCSFCFLFQKSLVVLSRYY
jgi:hypothetical protein